MALVLLGRWFLAPVSFDQGKRASLPPAEHALCRQAEAEVRAGKYDAALHDALQDLEREPGCPHSHLLAGLLYERRSVAKPALEHLAQAVQAFPNDARVAIAYGRVLALTGDYRRAIAILQPVAQRDGSRAEAFRWLGYAYMHLSQNPENVRRTEDCLRRAVAQEPNYAEANYDLGLLLFRQGKLQEALPFIETAVARRKHYPRGLYLLAHIHQTLGHSAEAARLQTQFHNEEALAKRQETLITRLSRKPKDIDTILEMARTMTELDKPQDALQYLQRAARLAPDDPRVRDALLSATQGTGSPAVDEEFTPGVRSVP